MAGIAKLNSTIDRYNQGCSFFQRAIVAWEKGHFADYENSLRKAATEAIGAVEWGLKIYLRQVRRASIPPQEHMQLKQPTFNDLMLLMRQYAEPRMDPNTESNLFTYRDMFRNAAEHDGSIPPVQELYAALATIRRVFLMYLPIHAEDLRTVNDPSVLFEPIERMRSEYFEAIRTRYEYMDLGGVSPRVGSKVVKIRMEDLFIPLSALEELPLLETYPTETSIIPPVDIVPSLTAAPNEADWASLPEANSATQVVTPEIHSEHSRAHALDMWRFFGIRRLVILGDPGSGKTTIGRYLSYSIATKSQNVAKIGLEDCIPINVRASDYGLALKTDPSMAFHNYLTQKHTAKYGPLFTWALDRGKCLIIIDGLDEIPEVGLRVEATRKIEQFVNEYQKNRFIVTSRIVGYRQNQISGDFVRITLRELDSHGINTFLFNWFQAIEGKGNVADDNVETRSQAEALVSAIEANPNIRKLAGNPLLLTIIALANRRGTKLPSRRVDLYQIATETLIENWPLKQRNLTLDANEVLAILEPIAFHIIGSGKNNSITEHELRPLFEKQVCEVRGTSMADARMISRELLRTIEEHTGFFLERGLDEAGQGVYGFLHLTFAEYLAARHLAEEWSSGKLDLSLYAHTSTWHEVLLLMAGHIGSWAITQVTKLVSDFLHLRSPFESYLNRDLLMSADILADNVRVRRDLQDVVVSQLISCAIATPIAKHFSQLTRALSRIASNFEVGVPATKLEYLPTDGIDVRFRKALIRAELDNTLNDIVLRTLVEGYGSEEIEEDFKELFFDIIQQSKETGRDTSGSFLIEERAQSIGYHSIDNVLVESIRRLFPSLGSLNALRRPTNGKLGRGAVKFWLLSVKDVTDLGSDALVNLLTSSDWQTRSIVAHALRRTEYGASLANDLVHAAIYSDEQTSRIRALDALQALRPLPSQVRQIWEPTMRSLYDSDPDPNIRAQALRVLSSLIQSKKDLLPLLMGALNDAADLVCQAASDIFPSLALSYHQGNISLGQLATGLTSLLLDESISRQRLAANALIRLPIKDENLLLNCFNILLHSTRRADTDPVHGTSHSIVPFIELFEVYERLKPGSARDALDALILNCIETGIYTEKHLHALSDPEYSMYAYSTQQSHLARGALDLCRRSTGEVRRCALVLFSFNRPSAAFQTDVLSLLSDEDTGVVQEMLCGITGFDLEHPQILHRVIELITHSSMEIAYQAASFMMFYQAKSDTDFAIKTVEALLHKFPENKAVFRALWELVVSPNDMEIPF